VVEDWGRNLSAAAVPAASMELSTAAVKGSVVVEELVVVGLIS
jgi:hypothetical protein